MLRMSRAEIGDYLGLTLETVSRTFSRLVAQQVLAVNGRTVRILDMMRLRQCAGLGASAAAEPVAGVAADVTACAGERERLAVKSVAPLI
jgi:CRP/FNR family transcriptional regulator